MATPYPIQATIQDIDGTVVEGASLYVSNITKGTVLATPGISDDSGIVQVDLINLPGDTPYENSDIILIVGAYGGKGSLGLRHTVVTTTGSYAAGTLKLNPGLEFITNATQVIRWVGTSNENSSAAYVKIYNYLDGTLIDQITTPANDSKERNYGSNGRISNGGIVIVRESEDLFVGVNLYHPMI